MPWDVGGSQMSDEVERVLFQGMGNRPGELTIFEVEFIHPHTSIQAVLKVRSPVSGFQGE